MAQPTSVPGQPSGIHGPSRPTHRPVALLETENIAKPWACQAPIIVISARHVTPRGATPPMNLAVSCVGHHRRPGVEILGPRRAEHEARCLNLEAVECIPSVLPQVA